ncbi:MAG: hypothetical protein AB1397_00760 [bacterium]
MREAIKMVKERLDNVDIRIERLLKSQEEFRKSQEEFRKSQEELREAQKKTDEQIKSLSEEQKKTDEQLKSLIEDQKKTDEQQRKTDEQLKRTDEELRAMFKKTDEEFEKTRKLVKGISDGWGRLTEGYAIASIGKIFNAIGIPIEGTSVRVRKKKGEEELEIDLINLARRNGKKIIIPVEVKTYLKVDDVNDFLKDINNFYEFFEEYKDFDLIGALAFMNPSAGAKKYAERKGIYLLSLSEDTMTLANKEGFKPKVWRYKG